VKAKKSAPRARKAAGTSSKPRDAGKAAKPAAATTVENWVNQLIIAAVRERADAIHVEPKGDGLSVRFRVDGVLRTIPAPDQSLQDGVIPRFMVMSRMKLEGERLPQDGRYGAIVDGREIDFRVSSLPTSYGESLVMRLLDRAGVVPLDRQGFSSVALTKVREMMARPRGLILVAGPTGSGKTTTLYGMLAELSTADKKVVTLEYPIEYDLDRVTQSQIDPRSGYDYPLALRMILRQDPDVVTIGDLADAEVATAALQTAMNGQLVLATIHAQDAAEAVSRLLDMGVEPMQLASGLEGVIAQRLVRQVCPNCKQAYAPSHGLAQSLELKPGGKLMKGRGCERCNNTGYKGRVGLFEVQPMTDGLRNLVLTKPALPALRDAFGKGGIPALQHDGLQKVIDGITTMDEVLRVTAWPAR